MNSSITSYILTVEEIFLWNCIPGAISYAIRENSFRFFVRGRVFARQITEQTQRCFIIAAVNDRAV